MKVLLRKDIGHLGIVGDVVEVSSGYARNYLVPNRLATTPTRANMRALAKERAEAEERRRLAVKALRVSAKKLAEVEVTIPAAANEEGVLYGSVGRREVAAALTAEGHEVQPEQVMLSEPIRHLDNAVITVKLTEDITADVKVWVVRPRTVEGEEAEAEDAAGKEAQANEQADR